SSLSLFFFTPPATTQVYTLSLHDALPISLAGRREVRALRHRNRTRREDFLRRGAFRRYCRVRSKDREDGNHKNSHTWIDRAKYVDRKSSRLNSSHVAISYAVFCLKKKKT